MAITCVDFCSYSRIFAVPFLFLRYLFVLLLSFTFSLVLFVGGYCFLSYVQMFDVVFLGLVCGMLFFSV